MSRHIIQTFQRMLIIGLSLFYQVIEDALHVNAYIGICILIDGKRTTGMFDKQM